MTQQPDRSTSASWARIRFSVVGLLLSSPPARGQLKAALRALADRTWTHPVSGREVRFSVVTIERWYYTAQRAEDDPVGVLRRAVRRDCGKVTLATAMAILDDHSRLCCHLQWYLSETAEDLVHGLSQAIQKRGLPRAILTDNGAAMIADEVSQGLLRRGIVHEKTLPYSPYQNGKQECFWASLEGRLMEMLGGVTELSLEFLNQATQAKEPIPPKPIAEAFILKEDGFDHWRQLCVGLMSQTHAEDAIRKARRLGDDYDAFDSQLAAAKAQHEKNMLDGKFGPGNLGAYFCKRLQTRLDKLDVQERQQEAADRQEAYVNSDEYRAKQDVEQKKIAAGPMLRDHPVTPNSIMDRVRCSTDGSNESVAAAKILRRVRNHCFDYFDSKGLSHKEHEAIDDLPLAVAVEVGTDLGMGETGVAHPPLIAKQSALRGMSRGVLDRRPCRRRCRRSTPDPLEVLVSKRSPGGVVGDRDCVRPPDLLRPLPLSHERVERRFGHQNQREWSLAIGVLLAHLAVLLDGEAPEAAAVETIAKLVRNYVPLGAGLEMVEQQVDVPRHVLIARLFCVRPMTIWLLVPSASSRAVSGHVPVTCSTCLASSLMAYCSRGDEFFGTTKTILPPACRFAPEAKAGPGPSSTTPAIVPAKTKRNAFITQDSPLDVGNRLGRPRRLDSRHSPAPPPLYGKVVRATMRAHFSLINRHFLHALSLKPSSPTGRDRSTQLRRRREPCRLG